MHKSFHFLVCGIRMAKNRWGKMPVKVDSWTFQKKREREREKRVYSIIFQLSYGKKQ